MKLLTFTIFTTIVAVTVAEPIPHILEPISDLNINLPTGYNLYADNGKQLVSEHPASPHQFPHQVYYITSEGLICSGSIIRNNAILTAAHCVDKPNTQVEIIPGAHHISKPEFPWQIRRSTSIKIHKDYSPTTRRYDIAVIIVDMGFILDGNVIDSVAVYSGLENPFEKNVSSSGWGWSKTNDLSKSANTELSYIVGKTLKQADCKKDLGTKNVDTVVCLKAVEGVGRCSIDAGGPLHIVQNNVLHVAGVFSFGPDGKSTCNRGKVTAFTHITKEISKWIKETVDGKKKTIF